MEGSVIIVFKGGWACSNEASIVVEKRLIRNTDGSMHSKHEQTIRVFNLYFTEGAVHKDDVAEALFKADDNGLMKAYETKVVGFTDEMAILAVTKETYNQKDIIKKIKGGFNYGK